MKLAEQAVVRQHDGGHGPLTLLLSLNLIMLSFFIMLNAVLHQAGGQALAGDEGRADTDVGVPGTAGGQGDLARGDWTQQDSGQILQGELRGLVANSLRLQTYDLAQDAKGLQLTLPMAPLFQNDGRTLSDGGQAWLENLGALLSGAARGWDARLVLSGESTPVLAARLVAVQRLLNGLAIDVGMAPDAREQVVLTLVAPAGIQTGRRVEQLQRGLVDGERGLRASGAAVLHEPARLEGIGHDDDLR